MELGYFDKNLSKTQEKETPQGNILEFFLLDIVKVTNSKNQASHGHNQGLSFQNQGTFFDFQNGREGLPSPPLVECM